MFSGCVTDLVLGIITVFDQSESGDVARGHQAIRPTALMLRVNTCIACIAHTRTDIHNLFAGSTFTHTHIHNILYLFASLTFALAFHPTYIILPY